MIISKKMNSKFVLGQFDLRTSLT